MYENAKEFMKSKVFDGKTFAEIELSKKNEVSHRGVAMRHFVSELKKVLK